MFCFENQIQRLDAGVVVLLEQDVDKECGNNPYQVGVSLKHDREDNHEREANCAHDGADGAEHSEHFQLFVTSLDTDNQS